MCPSALIHLCNTSANVEKTDRSESGVKKTTEKWFILVNSVSFSLLYNTGICSWHSLKGQSTQKQNSHPSSPLWSQHENNCHQFCLKGIFFVFMFYFLLKNPKKQPPQGRTVQNKTERKKQTEVKRKGTESHNGQNQPNN